MTSTRLSLGHVVAQCPLCVFPQEAHRCDTEHNSHGLMGDCVCPEHCNEEQFARELIFGTKGDDALFADPLGKMLDKLIFSYAHWHGLRDVSCLTCRALLGAWRLQRDTFTRVGQSRIHVLLWRGLAPQTSESLTLKYPFRGLAPEAECGLMTDFVETVQTPRLHEQSDYGFIEQPFEGGFHYFEIETLVRGQFLGLFSYVEKTANRTPPPAEWAYHYPRSQDAMEEHRPVHRSPETLGETKYAAGTGDDRGVEVCIQSNCLESKTWSKGIRIDKPYATKTFPICLGFGAFTYVSPPDWTRPSKRVRPARSLWSRKWKSVAPEPVTVLKHVLKPTIDRLYGDSLPNPHQIEALQYWLRQLHRKGLRNAHLLASLPHKSDGKLSRAALRYLETEFVYTKSRKKLSRGKLFRAERGIGDVYTSPRTQDWGPSGKPNKHALARLRRIIAKSTPIGREGQAPTPQDSQ